MVIGDAKLNGRELAVVSCFDDRPIPCLLRKYSDRIERIWQFFYRGAYRRQGSIGMTTLAAIDVALWGIRAKAASRKRTV